MDEGPKVGETWRFVYSDGPTREPRAVTGVICYIDATLIGIQSGRLELVLGRSFILRMERWEAR